MCNLYSMTKNVDAIRRLFGVDIARDHTGNLPSLLGIFPDYPAPIVRNGDDGRELVMARWGMPSSQKALMDATRKARAEARGQRQAGRFQGAASDGAQCAARTSRLAVSALIRNEFGYGRYFYCPSQGGTGRSGLARTRTGTRGAS
jgi:hypothetical protein